MRLQQVFTDPLSRTITYVLPAHNASSVLPKSLKSLEEFALDGALDLKVIIVENGSTDGTFETAKDLAKNAAVEVKLVSSEVGLGNALRRGLQLCDGGIIVCTASDLPFGFGDLIETLKALKIDPTIDACFGSKGHPDSQIRRGVIRRVVSRAFSFLRWGLTGLRMRDSQGSMVLITSMARLSLAASKNTGFLVTTETALICKQLGLNVVEVPVKLDDRHSTSTVRLLRHAFQITLGLAKLGRLKL